MASRKLAASAGGGAPDDAASEPTPTAPAAARYRVLCAVIVFPSHTARQGDVVELGETDVANMLPLGVIEPE